MNRGKYNLYAYTEGQTMEKIKSMKFYGTPVIFIPGHSGSYRQGIVYGDRRFSIIMDWRSSYLKIKKKEKNMIQIFSVPFSSVNSFSKPS